ncbi:hypothetical protein FHU29_003039 [Hoyosella altamirensis]|uniref:Uncharacterized protein n=1 Tax=Hoyosella altamirensis TaxID=616997 RepID=A0A839RPV9_9ACTN|nr:hypothetical protein [Hoyosella altamirensis]
MTASGLEMDVVRPDLLEDDRFRRELAAHRLARDARSGVTASGQELAVVRPDLLEDDRFRRRAAGVRAGLRSARAAAEVRH